MKKIISVILTVSLCVCMLFTLSGCAGVYDILNFNRKSLSNPDSPIEQGLENKYQRQENSLTKTEFLKLAADTEEAKAQNSSYEDNLKLSCSYNDQYKNTYYVTCENTLIAFDKQSVEDGEPYAQYFSQQYDSYYGYGSNETLYFFDDYFTRAGNNYKFLIDDEYLDERPVVPYEYVKADGMFSGIIKIISDNFESAYLDYDNGKEVLMAKIKPAAGSILKGLLPEYFSLPQSYGNLNGVSPAVIRLEGDTVCGIKIDLIYEGGKLNLDCKTSFDVQDIKDPAYGYYEVPSYVYHLINLTRNYGKTSGNYNMFFFDLKAEIELVNNYYETLPVKFDFYNIENKSHNGWERQFIKVITTDDEKAYVGLYNNFFKEKNGSVYQIDYPNNYENSEYAKYSSLFNDLQNFFRDEIYNYYDIYSRGGYSYGVPNYADIIPTQNGYKIQLEIAYDKYYYNEETYEYETVACKKNITFEVDKSFSKIFLYEYENFAGDKSDSKCSIKFTYDFLFTVPSEVTGYGKY